jgi:hypothetical protein
VLDVVAPDKYELAVRVDDFCFENLDPSVAQSAGFRPRATLAATKNVEPEVQHSEQHQQKRNACNHRHTKRAAHKLHKTLLAAAALGSSRTIAGTDAAFKPSITENRSISRR